MRIDFRQGIITYPSAGQVQSFLQYSGGFVSISSANGRIDVAFAQAQENYLLTESVDVPNAWGPLASGVDYWIYWDINLRTAVRTFGFTTLLPITSPTQPAAAEGQHWFNPVTNTMSVASSGVFRPVLRVFAAKVRDGVFTPLGSGVVNKPYAGTQVGVTQTGVRVGRILVDNTGSPIKRFDGTFFTTETDFFVSGSPVIAASLEGAIVTAAAEAVLPKFHVVKFTEFGKINLATYDDIQASTIALLTENLTINQVGTVVLQGYVTNPDWNWSTLTNLWINNTGALIAQDPHVTDPLNYPNPNPPVARVVSPTSVMFDQGLGGLGEKGDGSGPASTAIAGASRLSVAPVNAQDPIAVGTNDPRLSDARTPLSHTHPATAVTPTSYGSLTGANLQAMLQQVEDGKVAKTGATMTGPLVLSANPTVALEAATKQYVDGVALTTNKISQLDSSLTITDTGTNAQIELLLDNESKLNFTSSALTIQRPTNPNHWVATMGDTSVGAPTIEFDPSAVTIDAAGNTLVLGTDSAGFIRLVKISSTGATVWQLTLAAAGDFPIGNDVVTDSLNNIYVSAFNASGAAVIKLSSTGVIVWQKQLSTGVTYYPEASKLTVDSSDNLIIATSDIGAGASIILIKLSTVGTVIWAYRYATVGLDIYDVFDVAIDSSDGSIYVVGVSGSGTVMKFSASGALTWSVEFLFTSLVSTTNVAVGVGAQGVYVAAYGGFGSTSVVYRINKSNGALNWAYNVLYNGLPIKITSLVVDTTGTEKIIFQALEITTREYNKDTLIGAISDSGAFIWASQVGSLYLDDGSQNTLIQRLLSNRNGYIVGIGGHDPLDQRLFNTWAFHIPNDGTYKSAMSSPLHFDTATLTLTADTLTPSRVPPALNSATYTEPMPASSFVVASSTIPVIYLPVVIPINMSVDTISSVELQADILRTDKIIAPFATATTLNTGYGLDVLFNNTTGESNVATGYQSLYSNTTGANNTGIGHKALYLNAGGGNNAATGYQALYSNTSGNQNTATGSYALHSNTVASLNTAMGYQSLYVNTTGVNNTGVGAWTLYANTTGYNNTAVGRSALLLNTTGSGNTALGFSSLNKATTGYNNTAVGFQSLHSTTLGTYNTATGFNALYSNTTGISNIGIGYDAGSAITTGNYNVVIGSNTGSTIATLSNNIIISDGQGNIRIQVGSTGVTNIVGSLTVGGVAVTPNAVSKAGDTMTGLLVLSANPTVALGAATKQYVDAATASSANFRTFATNNTASGVSALAANTTGSNNTADGYQSLFSNTTGGNNVAVGSSSLYFNTSGGNNVATGYQALYSNTTAGFNVATGYEALRANTTGDSNIGIGYRTLYTNTIGLQNTACGHLALHLATTANYNTAYGANTLYSTTTGTNNTAVGRSAMFANTTGVDNVAIGFQSLFSNTTASTSTAVGSGALYSTTASATAVGYQSLYANTTGVSNTAFGLLTLRSNTTGTGNTAVGENALYFNTISSFNSALGYLALQQNTGSSNTGIGAYSLNSNTSGINNTAVGVQAMRYNTTGSYNVSIGLDALSANTTGSNNSAVGYHALRANTTAVNNSAFGYQALQASTTGADNVAVGYQALYSNTTGTSNVAIGRESLFSNAGGLYNVAVGSYAMKSTSTGSNNTACGFQALNTNTTGANNTASGANALYSNTTGGSNVAVGYYSLFANTTGNNNVAIGLDTMSSNTTGFQNTAVGIGALYTNTTVSNTTAVGFNSLYSNTTGVDNTAVGYYTLRLNTTGVGNTAIGRESLTANTTGLYNVACGAHALKASTTGSSNTAVGHNSLLSNTTAANNTAIGQNAMALTTSGNTNTAIGISSLYSNTTGFQNVAIGSQAIYSNSVGTNNVGIGSNSLYFNTGSNNTAIGHFTLYSNTTAGGNVAVGSNSLYSNTTGISNTTTGYYSLYFNTTGSNNTANGYQALYSNTTGSNNTANGYQALYSNTTGSSNIAYGSFTLDTNTTGYNNTAIGPDALTFNTTGYSNTACGYAALRRNTTSNGNTASGQNALTSNTTGNGNTASGQNALYANTTGGQNTASGGDALTSNTTGTSNTADGANALYDLGAAQIAGAFNVGTSYTIVSLGTTDFTLIGAATNTIGTTFTATGVGSGTGTATPNATNSNTAVGYNTGRGVIIGTGNTILGANVTGLATVLTNNIILASGDGVIKARHDGNNWILTGGVHVTGSLTPVPVTKGSVILGDVISRQAGTIVQGAITTDATITTVTHGGAGAAGSFIALPLDSTLSFDVLVVARRTDVDGESAAYQLLGCIKQDGTAASTALVGTVTKVVIAETTTAWDVNAVADTANGRLLIQVTGEAAKTIQWTANVRYAMVTG